LGYYYPFFFFSLFPAISGQVLKPFAASTKLPLSSLISRTCGAELLWNGRDLTTKWEQPWPQLVCCTSIYCRMCGCVFQEDGIVVRSFGEEWYRLIGVRIGQVKDINDFNL